MGLEAPEGYACGEDAHFVAVPAITAHRLEHDLYWDLTTRAAVVGRSGLACRAH